jgi:hypothetical protein
VLVSGPSLGEILILHYINLDILILDKILQKHRFIFR